MKDLIGKPVVSLEEGAQVGRAKDLVFQGLELQALVVQGEHGEGQLPYADIRTPGPDAITIESSSLIDWDPGQGKESSGKGRSEFLELAVVDAEGNNLGHVHDLNFDLTGQVEDIAVRTEGIFGIGAHETTIPRSQIRAVGPKWITVETLSKDRSGAT
jgi:sporulation protein YlmC with PRC-barrel domain